MTAPVKIFGRPAVMVPQPDGTMHPYLITPVAAGLTEWRAWSITGEDSQTYTVSELPTGWFKCDCLAFTRWTRFGCKFTIGTQLVCKHCYSVASTLGYSCGSANRGRTREGLAGHGRPDAPVADERGDNPAAHQGGTVSGTPSDQPAGSNVVVGSGDLVAANGAVRT